MALFSKKQKTAVGTEIRAHAPAKPAHRNLKKHAGEVLFSPRITEKGAYLAEGNAYVFNVARTATKKEIAQAVEAIFKVKPVMVRTARIPTKKVMSRISRTSGTTSVGKKAIVFLKKGDTIEIA